MQQPASASSWLYRCGGSCCHSSGSDHRVVALCSCLHSHPPLLFGARCCLVSLVLPAQVMGPLCAKHLFLRQGVQAAAVQAGRATARQTQRHRWAEGSAQLRQAGSADCGRAQCQLPACRGRTSTADAARPVVCWLQLITAVTMYMVDSRLLAWYALMCWGEWKQQGDRHIRQRFVRSARASCVRSVSCRHQPGA
jgi:hypothetical protein